MIKANFKAYSTYVTDSLHQWDINQVLEVTGLNLTSAPEVHFSNKNMDRAIVRQSTMTDHVVRVDIPNSLLQDPLRIYAHIGVYEGDTFKVVELVEIPVIPRKRPEDYQIEDTDGEIYSFKALENALANKADNARVDNILAHNNDTDGNTELLDVRYGADGVVYGSAGEAVREQFAQLAGHLNGERLEYLIRPAAWGELTGTSDTSRWVSNKLYKRGRLKSIDVMVLGSTAQACTVYIYTDNGDNTATLYATFEGSGSGLLTIEADTYIPKDFYVGITCQNCAFKEYPNSNYFAGTFGAENTILVPVGKTKYFHAYALRMDSMSDSVATKQDVAENSLCTNVESLTAEYLSANGITSVLDLPSNRVYKITDTVPASFGLPDEAAGNHCTLLKYSPDGASEKNTGYCVYELTVLRHGNTVKYFAYAVIDQAPDSLLWHKYSTARTNKGIKSVGLAPLNIVLIGDSIVEGYGCSDYSSTGAAVKNSVKTAYRNTGKKCWGNMFVDYMVANYADCNVVNNGVGGFTCQQVYENLASLVPDGTDVVILSAGTNDKDKADKGYAVTGYLRKTVLYLLERGIQPILLTNTPLQNMTAPNNAATIKTAIVEAGNDADVICCDVFSQFNYYLWEHGMELSQVMADQLHPNDKGYEIMFNIIKRELNV
jgi:lysophospholipase L1-like esterase